MFTNSHQDKEQNQWDSQLCNKYELERYKEFVYTDLLVTQC